MRFLCCFCFMMWFYGDLIADEIETDGDADGPGPGLVLAFDDGFANWLEVVAPTLAEAGGMATAFVNNRLVPDRLTVAHLRELQDRYGWEIASHGVNHHAAPGYVRRHGMARWEAEELRASLEGFAEMGITVTAFAFPYNALDDPLAETVRRHVRTYRRAVPMAWARGPAADGAHPATSIDLASHIPVEMLKGWVDLVAEHGGFLFLYGHRVLPDTHFTVGTVKAVSGNRLETETPLALGSGELLVLVPDRGQRLRWAPELQIRKHGENFVEVGDVDLGDYTRPGVEFLIGPAMATRLSDFQALLDYAQEKALNFTGVTEAVDALNKAQTNKVN